jgi:hypothetical protein
MINEVFSDWRKAVIFLISYSEGRRTIMAQFDFRLSNEDTNRLFAIKKKQGKDNMTGNEFAKYLLEKELHKLHPAIVRDVDENGDEIV